MRAVASNIQVVNAEPASPSAWPLGGRGEYPVFFRVMSGDPRARGLCQVPGIVRTSGGVAATWDAAFIAARVLNVPAPVVPVDTPLTRDLCPGIEEYRALSLHEKLRPYQKDDVAFLARRAFAFNCEPPRTGKTAVALAASILTGARRVLVVCPAVAKWVWAAEALKWLGLPVAILDGRAPDEARIICGTCCGSGHDAEGGRCPDCRAANGSTYGYHLHRGTDAALEAIRTTRFTVINYDCLLAQATKDAAGRRSLREDLPGWCPTLAQIRFDVVIADEAHLLRGRTYDRERIGESRRERFAQLVRSTSRVWGLTGTPIFAFTADLWGQLDAITGGLWGYKRWNFDVAYCEAFKGEYGWENKGRSNVPELRRRLAVMLVKKSRAVLLPYLPKKTRQVQRIDAPHELKALTLKKNAGATYAMAARAAATIKRPIIIDALIGELAASTQAEPVKLLVYCYMRETATAMAQDLAAAIKNARKAPVRLRELNTTVWCVTGATDAKGRFDQAAAFCASKTPGVFVATIDAMQVAISLKGAIAVHFVDLHHDPSAMLQAEDRPNEEGVSGLAVVYWVLNGSIDEHTVAVVLPKIETLEAVMSEPDAVSMRVALGRPEETLATIVARLTAHIGAEAILNDSAVNSGRG